MNYLAHGCRFLTDPVVVAGAALPDWLNVVARRTRVRKVRAADFLEHGDPYLARLAQGVCSHHDDDYHFHGTAAFAQLNWQFAAEIRDRTADTTGLRPTFVGHVLVEVLLDTELASRAPGLLDAYYRALGQLDLERLEWAVNELAPRPVEKLGWFVERFLAEKFLYDYAEDAKLLFRLNQVMRRVNLPPLPDVVADFFPRARAAVAEQLAQLIGFQPSLLAVAAGGSHLGAG